MNMLGLMWTNLFRKKTRTSLTLLSIMVAFLLFMLLRAISSAFDDGFQVAGADRMMVVPKFSQIDSLPYSQKNQILAVEGVEAIAHSNWFGGTYQDPKNFFAKFPVDPYGWFDLYPELDLQPEGALEKFANTRTAAVADVALVEKYGWKIGDVIPIMGTIYSKADGERLWEFELVGSFSEAGKESNFPLFLFHYDYFNEAVADFAQGQVDNWVIRITDPERADEIATEIDALFQNSADPTRTATEDEMNREFARQLGDITAITSMIMGAVFFTIVLLTANTMTQSLRERIPELAVLKTLGFTNTTVSLLVLGEAVLLCLVGGGAGIAVAFLISPGLAESLEGILGQFAVSLDAAAVAIGLSLVIGLVVGAVPALTARRLAIVDALRR